MNLVPVRESLTLPNEDSGNNETWDHLTIYDKRDDSILIRSGTHHPEGTIELEYDGLHYIVGKDKRVLITFESLINKFKKDE